MPAHKGWVTNWVTIAPDNRELQRTPAHLVILADIVNRTGYRPVDIALQARSRPTTHCGRLAATERNSAQQVRGSHEDEENSEPESHPPTEPVATKRKDQLTRAHE